MRPSLGVTISDRQGGNAYIELDDAYVQDLISVLSFAQTECEIRIRFKGYKKEEKDEEPYY